VQGGKGDDPLIDASGVLPNGLAFKGPDDFEQQMAKDLDRFAEAFVDGWYHTGDLGTLDASGWLYLRGRKKNIIVLANGMNVYPEDVEHALLADTRVKDAVVMGLTRDNDIEVHAVLLLVKGEDANAAEIVRGANQRLAATIQKRDGTRKKNYQRMLVLSLRQAVTQAPLKVSTS
jgi:long-chain acyl-CoA synthetase